MSKLEIYFTELGFYTSEKEASDFGKVPDPIHMKPSISDYFLDLNGTKGKSPVASPQKIRSSRPSLKGKYDSQPKNQPSPKKDQTKNRGNDSKNPVSLADSGFVSSHPSKNGIDQ